MTLMNNPSLMNSPPLPLILEPEALNQMPASDSLLIIAVVQAQVFATHHLPGSVLIEPAELVCGIKPAVGKLPDRDHLSAVFSRVGLRDDVHVIAYDDEGGGWAGRLIWTLDILGHHNYSYLNGGLPAWLKLGLPLESGSATLPGAEVLTASASAPSTFVAEPDSSLLVDRQMVMAQLDDPNSIVWDARSEEEYNGSKITAQRNGHIPGAVNLDWLQLMDRDNDLRLQPLQAIASKLESLGITRDKKIITHCHTHHRSGLTYLVGKALGYDIKAYDGSWSEWGNHADTPIEK
jgi:thiosulfate/3-mercaptopyruvate sulfurtransferase